MGKILNVTQVTDNRFLNMYDLDVEDKNGNRHSYQVASRARHKEALKISVFFRFLSSSPNSCIKVCDPIHCLAVCT